MHPRLSGFLGLLAGIALVTVPVVEEYRKIDLHKTIPRTTALVPTFLGISLIHLIYLIFAPATARLRHKKIPVSFVALFVLAAFNIGIIIPFGLLESGRLQKKVPEKERLLELLLELSQFICILHTVVAEITTCWRLTSSWKVAWFQARHVVLFCAALQCLLHSVLIGVSTNQDVGQQVANIIWYPCFLSRVAIAFVFVAVSKIMIRSSHSPVDYWSIQCLVGIAPKRDIPAPVLHCGFRAQRDGSPPSEQV
ncbi:hypothetical protein B0H67DRAFT_391006 [Lasiosphaeris hirsuta]|uniref:Uncharacterized protein n=1 Tax=Lasiosphaeris hirsuta TaxID=260670 RepID=A0AA39ZSA1_9PEZI|nr:hypothetical protein B0H67DRAFT_391006 [Lasiosphaeris hirsuta]